MKRKCISLLLGLTLMVGLTGCSSSAEETVGEPAASLGSLASFSATTLDGKTFTEEDLAKKDLTVINFWMTGCKPCIEEMPALAELEKKLPDNVQLLTVCLMGESEQDNVKQILDAANFTGTTLLNGNGDYQALCENITATPTTLFVDSEGNMLGDTILGAPENLEETLLYAINSRLKDAGKAEITLDE